MKEKRLIRFDWAIKRLLRNKADYTVLEGFLSVLLNDDIKIINIKESESNQEHAADKFNRVDMLVENAKRELLIIELQNSAEVDYYLRMLYGVSKAITEHMAISDGYHKVRKVYHINILYFSMGDGSDYVYHGITEYRGIHNNTILQLTPKQKEFFAKETVKDLYPEYYILCVNEFDNVAKSSLDEWIYYLKNTEIPENFTARGLPEAREKLLYDDMTEEEKSAYRYYIGQTRFEQNSIRTSYESGKFDGRVEGRTEGRAEGEAKGRAREKIEIALNLLKQGIPIETVSNATGLPHEQII
ncbi:MAG: Rpn family recombination-promoting nuclease/putative transposase [Chitinispirillales bacterium]|jgi:predicted transposase/invertase (TIGR01784 family)|nr:Rpn family recombination-promoting nuclease/putative transposase [Chitinispirillales bacterium]